MPRKYSYNADINAMPAGTARADVMRAWRKEHSKDRALQRIRNLGRVPMCPICQEPVYKNQRDAKQVVFCEGDARHQCHYTCWREWAQQTYADTTCPVCRHPYEDFNLKMETMKYAGNYETLGMATVDTGWLRMDEHGGWALGFSQPYSYQYNTFMVLVQTDDKYDESKGFDEWELSDFKHVHYSLYMMSLDGSSASSEHEMSGEIFYSFKKLLAAARRRKPALVQLGMREGWVEEMFQNVYTSLKDNVGLLTDTFRLMEESNPERNIAPFNRMPFLTMNCRPSRALRSVPAQRVVRVVGTVVDGTGAPKKFVLSTQSGKPFAYEMDEPANKVTLQADDAECNTVDDETMPNMTRFRIDMGLRKESFRSSERNETFCLGFSTSGMNQASAAGASENPWQNAVDWFELLPRTMVMLAFEDGSEAHYAQNEALPDSEDSEDSKDSEDSEDSEGASDE